MITVQREVKGDLPLEQEDSCLAILGETKIKGEKEEEEEECLLVKPELIDEVRTTVMGIRQAINWFES
jgi:hypothetical protein